MVSLSQGVLFKHASSVLPIKQLEQFIRQVKILVNQDNLAPEDGAALVQKATIIILRSGQEIRR